MRYFIRLSFLLCSLTLSGCIIPVPHKRLHDVGVKGRILDAQSHAPVVAAKIEDIVDPTKFTYSVIDGTFMLKPVYGLHGAYVFAGVSTSIFPNYDAPNLTRTITIIAPGYHNLTIPLNRTDAHDVYIDAGTIPLKR
ncbi:MAG TPA: hypothetical protein VGM54_23805 [Chthoniobacter sp.]|jgi:hypothetical protein